MQLQHFWRKRAVAMSVSATAATAAIVAGVPHVAYGAVLTGTVTISTPSNGKLAASTAKQVILLTVSGQTLSEALVTGVNLGPDSNCQNIPTYIVTSATTIAVKTPTGGCAATSASGGDGIDILFAGGNTLSKANGLFFVTAPSIASTTPVITDNSSLMTTPIAHFVANGGQVVRVTAGASFAFDPRSSAGLAVTFGGKAGTEVKVYDGTTNALIPASTSSTPPNGDYLTFKTSSGMTTGDPGLTITQGGVSKQFTTTDTSASVVNAPTVTSLSVTAGKTKAATSTVITGTGFDKTLADYGSTWSVKFCGMAATVTAVNTGGTALTVTAPDTSNDPNGLGTGNFAGSCPVTVTDNSGSSPVTSPVTPGSYFQYLAE